MKLKSIIFIVFLASLQLCGGLCAALKTTDEVEIRGTICGNVYEVNGHPISGATVQVMRMDDEGWWEATTASDGSYTLVGLPNGDFKVRAFKQSFAREYYDNVVFSREATAICVNAQMEATDIDFYLNEGSSISGYVYDKETGEPIQGAEIRINPSSERDDDGFHAVTDSSGFYAVGCLALGAYRVAAEATDFIGLWYEHVYDFQFATDVNVIPPNNTPNIDFSLSHGGSISGCVYDIDGNPVSEVWVMATGELPSIGWFTRAEPTDFGGHYMITNLPACNSYKVIAQKPGYAPQYYDSKITLSAADHVGVTESNDTDGINFAMDIGGSVTGHVYDEEDGTPISGIWLGVHLPTGEYVTNGATVNGVTDYDGSYTIWLGTGSYLIATSGGDNRGAKYVREWYHNSYDMENATIFNVTAPNETSGKDFYLAKAGSISGHVYNDEGIPISDASVFAFSDIYPGNGANSQSDGGYKIEGLPSGDYTVQVTVTDYFSEYRQDIVVDAPDITTGTNFILKRMPEHFIIEGFETGDFSTFDWEHDSDANWFISSSQKFFGTYSAQAGLIDDDEYTTLQVTFDCASGDITFCLKVSSESNYDHLRFEIDGIVQNEWSGEQGWIRVSFPVETGVRTFTWTYLKDSSVSSGSDTAWIDEIIFPVY